MGEVSKGTISRREHLEVGQVHVLPQHADAVRELHVLEEAGDGDAALLEGDLQPLVGGELDAGGGAERRLQEGAAQIHLSEVLPIRKGIAPGNKQVKGNCRDRQGPDSIENWFIDEVVLRRGGG